ncbi:Serine carboxypeptidase-like 20 [Hondaea fermentalgiana]|uniref:Carboxypeptidase n=1 Tax=Hondaea fermentalgiana TaxID=2315210 RepID=A0A2R5G9G2_9STRA|nr:Serine carboxypeptidase-like 20 [Hondaea fermentalgiana]|eukprot:GBG24314.1 Serine carboxypeptidase-like 20 [Hondaea fermentalgiana]
MAAMAALRVAVCSVLVGLVLLALTTQTQARVEADRVETIPGYDGAPLKMYSGYLDIADGRKHVHYVFIETQQASTSETTPLVAWFNGGPGCSSLDGLLYENGPFRVSVEDPGKLTPFEFAWTKLGHMLYLEAPVGVGFSYSDDPDQDYYTDDDKTAADNLEAIQVFFSLYPELKSSPFFLAGESYAGVYVPTLAEAIMKADKAGEYEGAKLIGMAVGNGCSGNEVGACADGIQREQYVAPFLSQTALISPTVKADLVQSCGDFANQLPEPTDACSKALEKMHAEVGNVNLYNIYGECYNGSSVALKAPMGGVHAPFPRELPPLEVAEMARKLGAWDGPVACIDSRAATAYLTQAEVVKALHVKEQPFIWGTCSNQLKNYTSNRENLPRDLYPALVEYLDRIIIYNGDWDSCVPWTDAFGWTKGLGFDMTSAWHPWTYTPKDGLGPQVAGYAINYKTPVKGNSFVVTTVKGGRHEVPETAPQQAFEMIRRLIDGDSF